MKRIYQVWSHFETESILVQETRYRSLAIATRKMYSSPLTGVVTNIIIVEIN